MVSEVSRERTRERVYDWRAGPPLIGHLQMTSFYHYDQNPSGFCFLVQIRASVFETSLGISN